MEHVPITDLRNGRPTGPSIHSAADLCQKEFDPVSYIVPGYIAEGCTLLAGRPKLGKSWLVLEIGLAVASGGCCLGGIVCGQGDVLFLALEDNERRLKDRIARVFGRVDNWPERFHYATAWSRANEGGLTAVERWVQSMPKPRLVIVDVLAMFRPTVGGSNNAYETDYRAIKGLQEIASKHRLAIIVVHHTRKGGGDADPFEKVSGTLGLSGAADTTLVLDRDGSGATLYARGRDIEEVNSAVEFNKGDCRWFVIGATSEVRRTDQRSAILDLLKEAVAPMSPAELADIAGSSRGAVRKLLHMMMKVGEVTKIRQGWYVHPDRHDLISGGNSSPPRNSGNSGNTSKAEYLRARDGTSVDDQDVTSVPSVTALAAFQS
jgi:AAA domain/IclR helix-turn-helix domain